MPVLSKYFAIARDLAILAALAWVIHWLIQDGENRVKVQDMAAVQKQIQANAQIEAQNEARRAKADAQHDQDLFAIHAAVAARNEPVIVYVKPRGTGPVPPVSGGAANQNTGSGNSDSGSGGGTCDVRAAISEFETKYETALADCRLLQGSLPTSSSLSTH